MSETVDDPLFYCGNATANFESLRL
jgi:hypothetical protein